MVEVLALAPLVTLALVLVIVAVLAWAAWDARKFEATRRDPTPAPTPTPPTTPAPPAAPAPRRNPNVVRDVDDSDDDDDDEETVGPRLAEARARAAAHNGFTPYVSRRDRARREKLAAAAKPPPASGPVESGGAGRDGFCLCERLVERGRLFEARWADLKDLGNDALRRGDAGDEKCYGLALKHYGDALQVATSPWPQWRALKAAAAADSSIRRALEIEPVARNILSWLPVAPQARVPHVVGSVKMKLSTPNLPAAICLGNRSYALVKLGRLAASKGDDDKARSCFLMARRDAKRAREVCPEYLKAHRRYRAALAALGDDDGAKAVDDEVGDFLVVNKEMSWNGPVLFAAGWIDHFDLMCVYQAARMQWAVELIKRTIRTGDGGGADEPPAVSTSASLVKFQKGQWLLFCVNWIDDAGERRSVEAFSLTATDHEHGDDLDLPPHGQASEASAARAGPVVAQTVDRLVACGLHVVSLTAGQGLVDRARAIERLLKQRPNTRNIIVIPAVATAASRRTVNGVF